MIVRGSFSAKKPDINVLKKPYKKENRDDYHLALNHLLALERKDQLNQVIQDNQKSNKKFKETLLEDLFESKQSEIFATLIDFVMSLPAEQSQQNQINHSKEEVEDEDPILSTQYSRQNREHYHEALHKLFSAKNFKKLNAALINNQNLNNEFITYISTNLSKNEYYESLAFYILEHAEEIIKGKFLDEDKLAEKYAFPAINALKDLQYFYAQNKADFSEKLSQLCDKQPGFYDKLADFNDQLSKMTSAKDDIDLHDELSFFIAKKESELLAQSNLSNNNNDDDESQKKLIAKLDGFAPQFTEENTSNNHQAILELFEEPIEFAQFIKKPYITQYGTTLEKDYLDNRFNNKQYRDDLTRSFLDQNYIIENKIYVELVNYYTAKNVDINKIPDCLYDPLTKKLFEKPMVASDGMTYESEELIKYLTKNDWMLPTGKKQIHELTITVKDADNNSQITKELSYVNRFVIDLIAKLKELNIINEKQIHNADASENNVLIQSQIQGKSDEEIKLENKKLQEEENELKLAQEEIPHSNHEPLVESENIPSDSEKDSQQPNQVEQEIEVAQSNAIEQLIASKAPEEELTSTEEMSSAEDTESLSEIEIQPLVSKEASTNNKVSDNKAEAIEPQQEEDFITLQKLREKEKEREQSNNPLENTQSDNESILTSNDEKQTLFDMELEISCASTNSVIVKTTNVQSSEEELITQDNSSSYDPESKQSISSEYSDTESDEKVNVPLQPETYLLKLYNAIQLTGKNSQEPEQNEIAKPVEPVINSSDEMETQENITDSEKSQSSISKSSDEKPELISEPVQAIQAKEIAVQPTEDPLIPNPKTIEEDKKENQPTSIEKNKDSSFNKEPIDVSSNMDGVGSSDLLDEQVSDEQLKAEQLLDDELRKRLEEIKNTSITTIKNKKNQEDEINSNQLSSGLSKVHTEVGDFGVIPSPVLPPVKKPENFFESKQLSSRVTLFFENVKTKTAKSFQYALRNDDETKISNNLCKLAANYLSIRSDIDRDNARKVFETLMFLNDFFRGTDITGHNFLTDRNMENEGIQLIKKLAQSGKKEEKEIATSALKIYSDFEKNRNNIQKSLRK